jgi:hypothetical protein
MKPRRLLWGSVLLLAVLGLSIWAREHLLAATEAEITRLRGERQALQARFQLVEPQHDPLGLGAPPPGDIVIGVPTPLSEELLSRAVTELLGEVRVQLTDLHIHHEEDVKARVLFADRRVAHLTLDLDLPVLAGTLHPGTPTLSLGANRIGVALQVSIVEGAGHGSMHFRWDAKGISDIVCGGLDVTREISGRVRPKTYGVKGGFGLSTEGDEIVAVPDFGDFVFRLEIEPSAASWAMVDEVIGGVIEDRNAICAKALKSLDVHQKIKEVVDQGFDVHLPPKVFRPIHFPAAFEESVEIKGKPMNLAAHPLDLVLTSKMLWFGANVGASQGPATAFSQAPSVWSRVGGSCAPACAPLTPVQANVSVVEKGQAGERARSARLSSPLP